VRFLIRIDVAAWVGMPVTPAIIVAAGIAGVCVVVVTGAVRVRRAVVSEPEAAAAIVAVTVTPATSTVVTIASAVIAAASA
jgi:hypothetical protein